MSEQSEQMLLWANVVKKLIPMYGKDCDTLDDLEAFLRLRASEPTGVSEPSEALPAPDYKSEAGLWRLTSPSGNTWHADSPIKCCQAEQRERIPADVALARIWAAVEEEDALPQPPAQGGEAKQWEAAS